MSCFRCLSHTHTMPPLLLSAEHLEPDQQANGNYQPASSSACFPPIKQVNWLFCFMSSLSITHTCLLSILSAAFFQVIPGMLGLGTFPLLWHYSAADCNGSCDMESSGMSTSLPWAFSPHWSGELGQGAAVRTRTQAQSYKMQKMELCMSPPANRHSSINLDARGGRLFWKCNNAKQKTIKTIPLKKSNR